MDDEAISNQTPEEIAALDRIAAALERIATALEGFKRGEAPEVALPDPAILSENIRALGLSTRARNSLIRSPYPHLDPRIETVGQLIQYTADELLDRAQLGQRCLAEVQIRLAEKGLKLKGE